MGSSFASRVWLLFAVLCGVLGADLARAADPALAEVTVPLAARAQVDLLERNGFIVGNVQGDVATVYLLREDLPKLVALGFRYTEVVPEPVEDKALGSYHSYAQVTSDLQAYANAHPSITRLISIGKSTQNRDLWALLISDNPLVEEAEPEFKYVSTMHGNEPVGTELLFYLVDLLLNGYGSDSRLTALVDSTAIWILPLMNPDGLELSRRGNANNVDLNRNFPTYTEFAGTLYDGALLDTAGRAQETRLVMQWSAQNSFVLSANLHTGALLFNYLYDDTGGASGVYAACPDDALVRAVSLRYAQNNPPMFASTQFEDGISNGAEWYVASGSMQDWNYRYLGCVEGTIELSTTKKPSSNTLPTLWNNNRESMLLYMESVHWGVRGVVSDRATGAPVYARVTVANNTQPVFTDWSVGDYYRLLLAGTYDLLVEANGFIPYRIAAVVVPEGGHTVRDVALSDGDLNADGNVDAADIQAVVNAVLSRGGSVDADVDGLGLSATDVQAVIQAVLSR